MEKIVYPMQGIDGLIGQVKELDRGPAIFDSGIGVFGRDIPRFGSVQEVRKPLASAGEILIASTGGSLQGMAKLFGEMASSYRPGVDLDYPENNVSGALGETLKNARRHGSKNGEDIYVAWAMNKSMLAVTVIDQGKTEFDPLQYSRVASPEMWLRQRNNGPDDPDLGHVGILTITGLGIGGKQVKEPMVDYIEWASLKDGDGAKAGTKVNMIFKPKTALK
ncbi:hypothetical protein ACFLRF_04685 [Candidatus Altiarchaeota archaeon]